MSQINQTTVSEFIIQGISEYPELQNFLFIVLLLIYLVTLMANLAIITVACVDSLLHTPMYFFLCNLSLLDMCYTTVTLHKVLLSFSTGNNTISFISCMVQLYFFTAFACTEFFLLTVMAYDRYVAICRPLHYMVVMNKKVCCLLSVVSWTIGFLDTMTYPILTSQLSFCGSNEIKHFFCDLTALLKLSCSDTSIIEVLLLIEGVLFGACPFLLTLMSYVFIISTIMKIHSVEGRRKAFSTCSSHLTVVVLFYGTIMFTYMTPTSMLSLNQNKLFAMLYTTVIPMLNPIIYSLKNKQVKNAFMKVIINVSFWHTKSSHVF
ncbi:olfactory receptor 1019-like [Rhinatrema bivittatum]|uniref:olfactory receptor 1019-like n=1 Tax=Rhinatrema bivittatum TaxID=194408 RepID=UPI001125CF8E|nr:olfactory receptor 1019-like [Rhinatrema bivittatum]